MPGAGRLIVTSNGGYSLQLAVSGTLFDPTGRVDRVDREISAELVQLGGIGQRLVVPETPRGVSGHLRGSIITELRGQPIQRSVEIFSSVFYAPIREVGRRFGRRPPTEALVLWVVRKLGVRDARAARGVAFVIARKIGARGYTGAFMFRKAAIQLAPIVQERAPALAARIARVLGGAA